MGLVAAIAHPITRAVAFTGSTETGAAILADCAPGMTRPLLELGGEGASVVFADADLDAAVVAETRTSAGKCRWAHGPIRGSMSMPGVRSTASTVAHLDRAGRRSTRSRRGAARSGWGGAAIACCRPLLRPSRIGARPRLW